jgi:hypothetical protein
MHDAFSSADCRDLWITNWCQQMTGWSSSWE